MKKISHLEEDTITGIMKSITDLERKASNPGKSEKDEDAISLSQEIESEKDEDFI